MDEIKRKRAVLYSHTVYHTCLRINQRASESPKSRRLVLAPFQRLRRRTTAHDNDNQHGGVSGHVVADATLPVIDERSMTSSASSDIRVCQNGGERVQTLLDAMHKKYYPDQYGVAAGNDVTGSATACDVGERGTTNVGTKTRLAGSSSAVCRTTATSTTTNSGDSPEGTTSSRTSENHAKGNYGTKIIMRSACGDLFCENGDKRLLWSQASVQIYFERAKFDLEATDSLTWVPEARMAKNRDWWPKAGVVQ